MTARSCAAGSRSGSIHCFWTFESIEDGQAFLAAAFGEPGQALGAAMTRPRLYNVAVYHRSFDAEAGSVA